MLTGSTLELAHSVLINGHFLNDPSKVDILSKPQNIRVEWTGEDGTRMVSYSDYFGFVKTDQEKAAFEAAILGDLPDTGGFEEPAEASSSNSNDARPNLTSGQGDGDDAENDGGDSGDGESNSSSRGGGGPPVGAIAGGVVGGVVFLALVAGLIFFLMRRRRRNKVHGDNLDGGYKTEQQQQHAIVADKDSSNVHDPQTPYSDTGTPHPIPAAGHATSVNRTDSQPLDDGASRELRRSTSRPGSQTPQGVSHSVAHLVEEGMTAEEIRRLEEEERHLDDEIERARRA